MGVVISAIGETCARRRPRRPACPPRRQPRRIRSKCSWRSIVRA